MIFLPLRARTAVVAKSRWFTCGLLVAILADVLAAAEKGSAINGSGGSGAAPVIWKLDDLKKIGGQTPTIEGSPKIVRESSGAMAAQFDGKADGFVLPVNPLAGFSQFTIEILFSPAADGEAEQRFFHAEDAAGRRALIELRLNKTGEWWLDTFLKPVTGSGLPLIDPKKVHPAGKWYWAALRYDGKTMSSFVNGVKELEGELAFEPMGPGQASVGVRLNRVYWFKGAIREVRFHPAAIAPDKLQKSE